MTSRSKRDPSPARSYRDIACCADRRIHERVAAWLTDLPAGSRVLDMPAGRGALTQRLADMGLQAEGADIFPEMFEPQGLICHPADMNAALPFPDASFDAIACVEGIEHIENPLALIREAHRILHPGGRLIITTPNILRAASRLRFLLTGFYALNRRPINEFAADPVADHISPRTLPQLRHILHTSGFAIRQVGSNRQVASDAWFYLLYPAAWLWTKGTMRAEPDAKQRKANAEIAQQMLSPDLLLGKVLLVWAERVG
jgi:2-polyprenyl-3-methyl-5-hydroxy-6-metoxy-1,4-benzoquinol methylase